MPQRPYTILAVSGNRPLLRQLSKFLSVFQYQVVQAADLAQATAVSEARAADFLLSDAVTLGPASVQLPRQVRRTNRDRFTYCMLLGDSPVTAEVTSALEAGYDDFLAAPLAYGELLSRLRAGARVIEFERRLHEQMEPDGLNGWSTKSALLRAMTPLLERSGDPRSTPAGGLLVFDLDAFRRLERQFGAAAGASLRREVGALWQEHFSNAELLATVGPDRFAVLLASGQPADWESAVDGALTRLREKEWIIAGQSVRLTASAGLAPLQRESSATRVLEAAEGALLLAKNSGRDCLVTHQEVQVEAAAWAKLAADGGLFATTTARDVMTPCGVFLHVDDTIEHALSLLEQTQLTAIPALDGEGSYAGMVAASQLNERRSRGDKPRNSGSLRLVRHILRTDAPRFEESAPLSQLMDFFSVHPDTVAIVLLGRRPTGLVCCQRLALLNEKLTRARFQSAPPLTPTSDYLLVPDLAPAEVD